MKGIVHGITVVRPVEGVSNKWIGIFGLILSLYFYAGAGILHAYTGTMTDKDYYSNSGIIAPINISGNVTDESGEPLIGVNIQVKGTNQGTATDFDGLFTLEDVAEDAILVVSYIGYQTQEIPVNGQTTLSITLITDSQLLDEVVVVGYGTQKKPT